MTIDLAGPSVYLVFMIVAIFEPTAVTYRINLAATCRVVAPPKPSSTYEPKTADVLNRWLNRVIQDSNHNDAHRQNSFEELALPKGIAMSM